MVSDCHVGHYNPTTENGANFQILLIKSVALLPNHDKM